MCPLDIPYIWRNKPCVERRPFDSYHLYNCYKGRNRRLAEDCPGQRAE